MSDREEKFAIVAIEHNKKYTTVIGVGVVVIVCGVGAVVGVNIIF